MPGRAAALRKSHETAALLGVPERGFVRRTVKDMIVDKLASLIATGVLQIGDELPSERDLAMALSVSRETVRGAVQTLAGRGIVETSQGARTCVVSTDVGRVHGGFTGPGAINRYEIDAVHAARLLVERAVVAEAALRIDDEGLARLDALLAVQASTMDDPIRFLISDREFHGTIYRASQNPLLCDFVIDLYTYMLEQRRSAVSQPGAIRRSYEDHKAIVRALRAHDPAATAAAFGEHIERIYVTTRSVLKAGRGDSRAPGSGPEGR
jgi:DNA-binding FadR family transcriptional regulator